MLSSRVPDQVSLHLFWNQGAWCSRTLELGPLGETASARVRVHSREVAKAEGTLVSLSPWRAEVRARVTRWLKCRVRVQCRLSFHWRVPVHGTVRVRVKSQEASGAKRRAGQSSPQRAELKAQGMVPFRISLWLTRPHSQMGQNREASGIDSGRCSRAWETKC